MRRIDEKDHLKGGVDAKNLKKFLNRFDPKEVKMGVEDEKEHTKDPAVAAEIASDHLAGSPHYYSRLKRAHIESTDIFDFNFHDILESNDDMPLSASMRQSGPPKSHSDFDKAMIANWKKTNSNKDAPTGVSPARLAFDRAMAKKNEPAKPKVASKPKQDIDTAMEKKMGALTTKYAGIAKK